MRKSFTKILMVAACCLGIMMPDALANGKILFVPHDNRPISFEQTSDTVKMTEIEIVNAPNEFVGNREMLGKPDELWQWVFANAKGADAVVLSSDALLYGSLVGSRKHNIDETVILNRVDNFTKLKQENPNLEIYAFGSIMRTPRASGSEEPEYYAKYGPSIFQYTALLDKKECVGLSRKETKELAKLEKSIPQDAIEDWMARRSKNFAANSKMIHLTKDGVFRYLALGRDDNAPFSQTHKESRQLDALAQGLSISQFQTLSGIDEMAMVMLTRAINDETWNVPLVAVRYADGVGGATIPTYSDEAIETSIHSHLFAAGAIPVLTPDRADLVLMVNTNVDGKTGEANFPTNTVQPKSNTESFVQEVKEYLSAGYPVAIADIAYANGADNSLMAALEEEELLDKIVAYSGWNTANNSAGFVIGQGILSDKMTLEGRHRLLAVRLLDDWAYQANIRQVLAGEIATMQGGNYSKLDEIQGFVTKRANEEMNAFAKEHLKDFSIKKVNVDFPWNRMFEAGVEVE